MNRTQFKNKLIVVLNDTFWNLLENEKKEDIKEILDMDWSEISEECYYLVKEIFKWKRDEKNE